MANFKQTVITKAAHNLIAKSLSGSANINFTRVATSKYDYKSFSQSKLESLTSLEDIKQYVAVDKVEKIGEASVNVSVKITNANITEGYYVNTIGLFAIDPEEGEILYSVTVAETADYFPADNGVNCSGINLDLVTEVSNASNVNITVNYAGYATNEDIEKVNSQLNDITIYLQSDLEDFTLNLNEILSNLLISQDKKIRIILPLGVDVSFTEITLVRSNVEFYGGCLDGNLKIQVDGLANIEFNSVKLLKDIEITKGRGIQFNNCIFYDTDKSIFCNPTDNATFHGIAMVGIYGCRFYGVNYTLYIDKNINGENLQCNDFTYVNNYSNVAKITGVYAKEIDGLIVDNSTFFTQANSNIKENNIRIDGGDWIQINSNQLFESGYESIYLYNCRHQNVNGNMIAWNGAREPRSAIKIACDPDRHSINHAITNSNIISATTKHGIEIENAKYQTAIGNSIECRMINGGNYYGETDLSSIKHYGISSNRKDYSFYNFNNNNLITGSELYGPDIINANIGIVISTDAPTIRNYNSYSIITLESSSKQTFTSIEGGCNGDKLTLLGLNNNVTLQNNSSLILQNNLDINIPTNGSLTLIKIKSKWYEISRNFS